MQPTRTQAIKQFLLASTHADLANLYNHDMEVQVNVAQDGGTRIDGDYKGRQWHGFTDGIQTWKMLRIPYKANTVPEYIDVEINFDLAAHAEGIGMTGWDWVSRTSRWVAFDFDAISGHSDKHSKKLTDEELTKLVELVSGVEWVTVRKSTGGRGLHIYVFLEPVPTANHTEHAALARAILGKLSLEVKYDFTMKVDTCGGNAWIWHRKLKESHGEGLKLIKSGGKLSDIPANWKDHVKVITGRKSKVTPKFIEDQESGSPEIVDKFAELCGQRVRVPLDDDHKRLMDWLQLRYPNASWWDQDHWMLVSHTSLLAEAHEDLSFKGIFATLATGKDRGSDINCFMYPMINGAWAVRRYTPGVAEHVSWNQDGAGWTRAYLNRAPDFVTACRSFEGIEDPAGGYWFSTTEQAMRAAALMKADLKIPNWALMRKCKLKEHKSGRLQVEMVRTDDDNPKEMDNWLEKGGKWHKLYDCKLSDTDEPEIVTYDDEVRHLITASSDDRGWVIHSDGSWHSEPFMHVKSYLQSRGHDTAEVQIIIGSSVARCWRLVNMPFQPEYPKDRQWNRGAAQFRYPPTIERDNLKYPTWLKILRHVGRGLDDAISLNEWAKVNNVLNGADYLKCWIASLLKAPREPLPYLFFYGPQNSGKSIFHESISLLMTSGVVRADTALTSTGGFNGELETAILAVVEETDLRKNKAAYERIKDWVTSPMLPIHAKRQQPYLVENLAHFVQTSNDKNACPIFAGDTRITMCYVPEFEPGVLIPRRELMPMLQAEAPDFMAEIMNLELPASPDRLNLPVIATEDKVSAGQANQNFLEMFIEENCHYVEGSMILFSEFYEKFAEFVDPNYLKEWGKIRVGRDLPHKYPKGRHTSTCQFHVGNISWEAKESKGPRLISKDGKLVAAPTELKIAGGS